MICPRCKADTRAGRQCRARGHDVIHKQYIPSLQPVLPPGMRRYRTRKSLCPLSRRLAIQDRCSNPALQKVRTNVQPGLQPQMPGQKCGLIIPPSEQPRPMQRNRRNHHVIVKQTLPGPRHPKCSRACQLGPVPMFQGQNQRPGPPVVEQRRPPVFPRARCFHAVIALDPVTICLAWQGHSATMTY